LRLRGVGFPGAVGRFEIPLGFTGLLSHNRTARNRKRPANAGIRGGTLFLRIATGSRLTAVADTVTTVPTVQENDRLAVRIEDAEGGREALVLHFIKRGAMFSIL